MSRKRYNKSNNNNDNEYDNDIVENCQLELTYKLTA